MYIVILIILVLIINYLLDSRLLKRSFDDFDYILDNKVVYIRHIAPLELFNKIILMASNLNIRDGFILPTFGEGSFIDMVLKSSNMEYVMAHLLNKAVMVTEEPSTVIINRSRSWNRVKSTTNTRQYHCYLILDNTSDSYLEYIDTRNCTKKQLMNNNDFDCGIIRKTYLEPNSLVVIRTNGPLFRITKPKNGTYIALEFIYKDAYYKT